jgi:hypothetical protein
MKERCRILAVGGANSASLLRRFGYPCIPLLEGHHASGYQTGGKAGVVIDIF